MFYMGPKIWDLVPKEMKKAIILNEFKTKIKIWKLENCTYRLSRTYLPQTGFKNEGYPQRHKGCCCDMNEH